MSVSLDAVKELLQNNFKDAKIILQDVVGDGAHFELKITSDSFINKSSIERHKMVYDVLGSIVGNEMHALSIIAKTFAEIEGSEQTSQQAVQEKNLHSDMLKKIDELVHNSDVVLFMKGTKEDPMCGFSYQVASTLLSLGLDFVDINVLADQEVRENIKLYTNWPTIPQLFIKGEFIGGCDITMEMYHKGELQSLLSGLNIAFNKE